MTRLAAFLLLWLALSALSVYADKLPLLGVGSGGGGSAYVGPLDILPSAEVAVGLRCPAAANAGTKAINIRRASDNTTSDINYTTACDLDTATANTFCTATTCFITTLYDKSGNGFDLSQATAGDQPQLMFNATTHGKACMGVGASSLLTNASPTITSNVTIAGFFISSSALSTTDFIISMNSQNVIFIQNATAVFDAFAVKTTAYSIAASTDYAGALTASISVGTATIDSNLNGSAETASGSGTASDHAFYVPFNGGGNGEMVCEGELYSTTTSSTVIGNLVSNAQAYW